MCEEKCTVLQIKGSLNIPLSDHMVRIMLNSLKSCMLSKKGLIFPHKKLTIWIIGMQWRSLLVDEGCMCVWPWWVVDRIINPSCIERDRERMDGREPKRKVRQQVVQKVWKLRSKKDKDNEMGHHKNERIMTEKFQWNWERNIDDVDCDQGQGKRNPRGRERKEKK